MKADRREDLMPYADIAAELGITRQRARAICLNALRKLKGNPKMQLLRQTGEALSRTREEDQRDQPRERFD